MSLLGEEEEKREAAEPPSPPEPLRALEHLVFVGFNSRIAALDRRNGELVWSWKSPSGSGYVAVLLDGDRLIASVQGYTFCLDPLTGRQAWANHLPGFGTGVPSMASLNGHSSPHSLLAEMEGEARRHSSGSTPGH